MGLRPEGSMETKRWTTRNVDKISRTPEEKESKAAKARASCKRFMDVKSKQLRIEFKNRYKGKLLRQEYGKAVRTAYDEFLASEVHYLNWIG